MLFWIILSAQTFNALKANEILGIGWFLGAICVCMPVCVPYKARFLMFLSSWLFRFIFICHLCPEKNELTCFTHGNSTQTCLSRWIISGLQCLFIIQMVRLYTKTKCHSIPVFWEEKKKKSKSLYYHINGKEDYIAQAASGTAVPSFIENPHERITKNLKDGSTARTRK